MTIKIIGLIGAKGAGKTTVFKILQELTGAKESMLAATLKATCVEVLGLTPDQVELPSLKEKELEIPIYLNRKMVISLLNSFGFSNLSEDKYVKPHVGKIFTTPRQVLQYVGTEILRAVESDIHCRKTKIYDGVLSVVTDIRFPNELDFFEENYKDQFTLVYIKNVRAEQAAEKDGHASEKNLFLLKKRASFMITNEGSMEELRKVITNLVNSLGIEKQ